VGSNPIEGQTKTNEKNICNLKHYKMSLKLYFAQKPSCLNIPKTNVIFTNCLCFVKSVSRLVHKSLLNALVKHLAHNPLQAGLLKRTQYRDVEPVLSSQ